VTRLSSADSSKSSPAAPYVLHDDEKTKRRTADGQFSWPDGSRVVDVISQVGVEVAQWSFDARRCAPRRSLRDLLHEVATSFPTAYLRSLAKITAVK
jgi:hypothetical protein